MGGCTAQCSQPMGALFCDGQYVDTGNNLQMCIDDLKAALNITVMASASGQCSGNTCTGKANASASCALSPGSTPWSGGSLLAGLGLGLAVLVRRRTKR